MMMNLNSTATTTTVDVDTYITAAPMKLGQLTHWVGDFVPSHPTSLQPWVPNNMLPLPYFDPYQYIPPSNWITITGTSTAASAWRTIPSPDGVRLTVDVPGVIENGIDVTITRELLTVAGKRYDTGLSVFHTYKLDASYDASTAVAELSNGILTVSIKKAAPTTSRKVAITTK